MRNKRIMGMPVRRIILIAAVIVIVCIIVAYDKGVFDRTNEEYIAILIDNKEDFEYVARIMQQWDEGRIAFENPYGRPLDFDDSLIENSEIESEMSDNIDFYNSLNNLYNLDEIRSIEIREKFIMFYFSKPPRNHTRSGFAFMKDKRRRYNQIDENWDLIMWGDT